LWQQWHQVGLLWQQQHQHQQQVRLLRQQQQQQVGLLQAHQQQQVGLQYALLLQQQQEQRALLQWHQQEQQVLLKRQQQLAADIGMYQRGGQAVYDAEMKRRKATAAETRQHGSQSYGNIRDSTMVCWSRFPPEQMQSFFRVFEQKGHTRSVSTAGTDNHKDVLPADAARLARSAHDSMREEMAKTAASPPDFSRLGEGLAPLVETVVAADHAVAALLSRCMAAVEATRPERLSEEAVVVVGMVQNWLVGECGSYLVCVSAAPALL